MSACLLGERVRWNAGHKRDDFLTGTLAPFVEWHPVCPEVEIGLGVPRPRLQLRGKSQRLVESGSGKDHSKAMDAWAARFLEDLDVDGFVLKQGSPTCAPDRVRFHADNFRTDGHGRFARRLARRLPMLPTIDDGRLHDPGLREAFIDRVFAHARWRELGPRPTLKVVREFHARNKYTLLSHDPAAVPRLGRMLAMGRRAGYGPAFMQAMQRRATKARHLNVLQHIRGFLKDLDATARRDLDAVLEQYRAGLVPLVVPVTLLAHRLRTSEAPAWVLEQTYLRPYPMELMLRNHV